MANQPRPDNPHRMVRVEDDLWRAAGDAADQEGTTRSEVMREALRDLVNRTSTQPTTPRGDALIEIADLIETLPRNEFGDQHYLAVDAAYANVATLLSAHAPKVDA